MMESTTQQANMTPSGVQLSLLLVPTEDSGSPIKLSIEHFGVSGPSERAPEQEKQQRQPGDITDDAQPSSTALDQEDQARPMQPPAEQEQEDRQAQPFTAKHQPPEPAPGPPSLAGRSCLLVSAKPSALVSQLATSLLQRGASVTVAFKHSQDASLFVRSLLKSKHLPPEAAGLLSASAAPVSLASQASVRHFAGSINASEEQLDLLVLHTAERASSSRRWYTPEGVAGQAQVGFLGPATLLHLLTPKLAASGTAILLTASPLHRLGHVDDLAELMTTWAGGSPADTQVALLAYVRQLAQHLKGDGVTAAAVDVGLVREQPLEGSVLRKLPPLHQLLHLLLPSASDSAHLMASIAEQLLPGREEGTTTGTLQQQQQQRMGEEDREGEMQQQQVEGAEEAWRQQAGSEHEGVVAAEGASAEQQGQEPSQQQGPQAQLGMEEQQGKEEGPKAETAGEEGRMAGYGVAEAPAGAVLEDRVAGTVEGEVEQAASQPEPASTAAGGTGAGSSMVGDKEAQAEAQEPQDQAQEQQGPGGEGVSAASGARPSSGQKSFRYFSRGLLATPLITYVDHAGRSTWLSHSLSALTFPFYQLTASSIIRSALLLDWPVRAWLLGPAGALPAAVKPLLGSRAAGFVAQLQRRVPGVEGVPQGIGAGGGVPGWVEVMPAGLVMNEQLGGQLWQLVEGSAVQGAA